MPATESEVVLALCALVAEALGVDPATITPEGRIVDLGLSSVKVLHVVAKLERRFGLEVPDDLLFRAETLGELGRAIATSTPAG